MNIIDINKTIDKLYMKLQNANNLNQSEKLLIKSLLDKFKKEMKEYLQDIDGLEDDIEVNEINKILENELINQLIKIEDFLNKKN